MSAPTALLVQDMAKDDFDPGMAQQLYLIFVTLQDHRRLPW